MARPLERVNQLSLLPISDNWDDIAEPLPLDEPASTNNYRAQWRSYVEAARAAGWSPVDVHQHGTVALAQALADAELRHWAPATITRYAKLARYAGVDPAPHPPPHTTPIADLDHRRLWQPRHHPITQRNALAAVLTWHTPIQLPELLDLNPDQVSITSTGGLVLAHDSGTHTAPVGGDAAREWLANRRRWAPNPWLLCTTHPSRTGHPPGSRLSIRGFQASFARHCALANQPELSWRRYRALAGHDETV